MEISEFEKIWLEFMLKNKKWDRKKQEWRFPRFHEYHPITTCIWNEEGKHWENKFVGYEMGPLEYRYCVVCGNNLDELRNPSDFRLRKRNVIKFCSDLCKSEYKKRRKIQQKEGENSLLSWPTRNGERIFRNEITVSKIINEQYTQYPLKAKKSKFMK